MHYAFNYNLIYCFAFIFPSQWARRKKREKQIKSNIEWAFYFSFFIYCFFFSIFGCLHRCTYIYYYYACLRQKAHIRSITDDSICWKHSMWIHFRYVASIVLTANGTTAFGTTRCWCVGNCINIVTIG